MTAFSEYPQHATTGRYCICVVGWHFLDSFFEKIYELECEKFIICHRDADYVQKLPFYDSIAKDVLYCPNIGLDWGAYYQFNEMVDYQKYDFVIYCHDDLLVKDLGFAQALQEHFLDPAIMVVGNGKNGKDSEFRFGKYKDRMFFKDDDDFVIRTVRGSFLAVRTAVFSEIENFPVYWKTKNKNPKKGNISLRNFGYVVSKKYGRESITYLEKESWLETKYIIELRRGELAVAN